MVPEWVLYVGSGIVVTLGVALVVLFIQGKKPYEALWTVYLTAVLVGLPIVLFIPNGMIQKEITARTPRYFGELVAGDEPSPALPPGTPGDTVQLLLGDQLRVLSRNSNNFVLRKDGKAFLSFWGAQRSDASECHHDGLGQPYNRPHR
jgi:hypothetical protein